MVKDCPRMGAVARLCFLQKQADLFQRHKFRPASFEKKPQEQRFARAQETDRE